MKGKKMMVKTLADWQRVGGSLSEYLKQGDTVDEGLEEYFLEIMYPAYLDMNIIQMGEAADVKQGRAVFHTLKRKSGAWVYEGLCFLGGDHPRS